MASTERPRVYVDADVFLHVLLDQEHSKICSLVLEAAVRGDIRLIASRYLMVEIGAYRHDGPGATAAASFIEKFLEGLDTEWVEVDIIAARKATETAWVHNLRAGDALHLATALRRNADYFMSYDKAYPFGTTLGKTVVMEPGIVWQPTLEDGVA